MQTLDRPLIFLTHSLGGSVVKVVSAISDALYLRANPLQALVHSSFSINSTSHDLLTLSHLVQCTKGVIFFGTPHLGSGWSYVHKIVLDLLSIVTHTNSRIVKQLMSSSPVLEDVQHRYVQISGGISNVFFVEQHRTSLLGLAKQLVSLTSTGGQS